MRHIPATVLVLLLPTAACGPGGFTAAALESSETSNDTDVPGEDDDPPDAEDEGWATDDEGESDSADQGESEDEDDEGDGDGDDSGDDPNDGAPNGSACTQDDECASLQCYVIPFLGGVCGECNEDSDCFGGGCTPHSPFDNEGSTCNAGELGGGCESDDACMMGLECANVFSLLGVLELNSCSECLSDGQCGDGQICAPMFTFAQYAGARTCVPPNSLPQDSYCELENNGNLACASGRCSAVDIMGLAQMGACGECLSDDDCGEGTCVAGLLDLDNGMLTGSQCDGP